MWQSSTITFRIMIATAVTLCIFVIYVKRSLTFNIYSDYHQVSRNMTHVATVDNMSSYSNDISKDNSKAADVDFNSRSARTSGVGQSSNIRNGSNTRNTFETLLKSKPKRYETSRLKTGCSNTTNIESDTRTFYRSPAVKKNASTWNTGIFQNNKSFKEKETRIPYFQTFETYAYDIINMDPITFDPAFKNPCWRGKESFAPLKDEKLHCLPYFYIVGVKKSGTTDFYSRLQTHPEYCRPLFGKESQWLTRLRFGMGRIKNNKFQPDASPSTFHLHTNWELLPGNENLTEPHYTNFHYIQHITPRVKIIILYRDPSTRHIKASVAELKEIFPKEALNALLNSCKKNIELAESFNAGFYAIFTMDLLAVFGKAQLLPILMTDYVKHMEETLRNAFKFLHMSTVSSRTMQRILKRSAKNVSKRMKKIGPMLDETYDMLYDFYRPYNEDMAALMNDTRYLFPKLNPASKSAEKDISY